MMNASLLESLADDSRYSMVPRGEYAIGVDTDGAERIIPLLRDDRMKPEWLTAATPRHAIALSGCRISNFLVTRGHFALFVDATGYRTEAERDGWGWVFEGGWQKRGGVSWRSPFLDAGDDACRAHSPIVPVMQASWNDAEAFCRWLSEAIGRRFRMPTEGEWEAFAGMHGAPSIVDCMAERVSTAPVDSREYVAMLIAAADADRGAMPIGHVWEWCADWYDAYPGGPHHRDFGATYRVLRGGSLMSRPAQRGREYRFRRCPTARSPYYGVRLAMDIA